MAKPQTRADKVFKLKEHMNVAWGALEDAAKLAQELGIPVTAIEIDKLTNGVRHQESIIHNCSARIIAG